SQDPSVGVDLTLLAPDGDGGLEETAKVADLSDGRGVVSAVRFVADRVLISTGQFGRGLYVIDVSDPAAPRRAGELTLGTTVGYFHPLPDHRALVVGARSDEVGEGNQKQYRSWVQAQLLDVADPDAPKVVATWERPWVADEVGWDHHAFTYWPDRELAMWGLRNTEPDSEDAGNPAVVLRAADGLDEVAVPVASEPPEAPSPCPAVAVSDEVREMIGEDGVVLRCGDEDREAVEWPRYRCFLVDDATVQRFAAGEEAQGSFFSCSPAPPPMVRRVLVVSGRPILFSDQTLEALDPSTFRSAAVAFHPSEASFGY
ncbi:MAG: beta-propeller domain-containing protein, partial [Acidimicrobiales bacterium]